MDKVDDFLKHVSEIPRHHLYGGPYYDQEFCEFFNDEYRQMDNKIGTTEPLTKDDLLLLKDLLWQDERLPMFNDGRLARDHESFFVYRLAVRLLKDRLSIEG